MESELNFISKFQLQLNTSYYMKHILLIDDNDIDNYISKHIIQKHNISDKISIKSSGIKALEYLESILDNPSEFPDLILLDLKMPVMDGFGFLDVFTKFPKQLIDNCPVFMLTSSNDITDVNLANKYDIIKKYLNKPLSKEYFAIL